MRPLYTIDTETAQVRYAGNGVTTVFSVAFQFFEPTTIRVQTVVDETATLRVLNVDYTVSGGAGETGTVTFVTAPPTGTTVVIDLDTPFLQETIDLAPNGPLPAEDVEQGFDRVVTMVKQLNARQGSTPRLSAAYDPDDGEVTMPPPVNGEVLVGNAGGTGWEGAAISDLETTIPAIITGAAEGDLLVYDAGSSSWRNNKNLKTNRVFNLLVGTGATSRLLSERAMELPITPYDFGAVGNNTADDADALEDFLAFVLTNRVWGHFAKGIFRCSRQLDINLDQSVALVHNSLRITTAGQRNSIISFDDNVASPCLTIRCTGLEDASFYFTLAGLGVNGNTNGKMVMVGDAALAGAFNSLDLDLNVTNNNSGSSAIGIEFNYVVSSMLRYTANVAGTSQGTAVKMNQCHGLLVHQPQHGNALRGLHMTGVTYGNVFLGSLFEVLGTGIVTDNVNTFTNSFRGGLISQNGNFISSTNGSNNVIDAMVWDGLGNFFDGTNYTGWTLQNQRNSLLTVPTVGTSPWSWTNNCGQAVMAYLTGGIVSAIVVNGSTLQQATECAVMVPPGQVLQVTHTSTPGLSMQVVQ